MARLIWTEPALEDLGQIADYIALDDPAAAKRLIRKVFVKVELLQDFANRLAGRECDVVLNGLDGFDGIVGYGLDQDSLWWW